MRKRPLSVVLSCALLLTFGCSPVGLPSGSSDRPETAVPKRVTAAIMGDANTVVQKLNPGSTIPGIDTLQELVHAGLTIRDNQGGLRAQLAETAPTIENGLWKLLPDGQMETNWRIRPSAQWHDGTPVTAEDLLFTVAVAQDKDLPLLNDRQLQHVQSVTAPDPATVTVRWKQPFIDADRMFSSEFAYPLPKHLLEPAYFEVKDGFLDLPYWSDGFVGAGPFRLQEFVRGSHLLLKANGQYVLGRPKIDAIEIRFVPDSNTLLANVLAGVVELTIGRSISVDQAIEVNERWAAGRSEVAASNMLRVFPQFLNPDPAVILDLRFRRALLHAINRQEMADTLQHGVTPVAHSYLSPDQPQYRDLEERYVVRYEYDPARAAQMIEAIGHARGPDRMFRDATGQPLSVDLLVSASQEINVKSTFTVADYWQRVGVDAKVTIEPLQLRGVERSQYEATWPGFTLIRTPNDVRGLRSLHGSEARTPERRYTGSNRANYMNADLDALVDRYFVTIPLAERRDILGQIIYHISDQLPLLPLFYGAEPVAIAHRLQHVGTRPTGSTQAWNAHEWDARSQ